MRTFLPYIALSLVLLVVFVGGYFLLNAYFFPKVPQLSLTSSAFAYGQAIPTQYTCDGDNISPPLSIANVPEGTQSLILIMNDPDVPTELKPDGIFDHWILYAMPPDTKDIPENSIAGDTGINDANTDIYIGPCPPPDYEPKTHRYFFRIFALASAPIFAKTPTKEDLLSALEEGNVLGTAELMGTYTRGGSGDTGN